ncbi:hep_Hag family protein [Collimonas pratensis]|uniref:Hep_Hag family protein n=1 Tax=Collimonas pratensis TaxID=279113 RepID=A0A127Q6V0_9BURK|nr:hep_Hag family protein [Collimonas pratensis]
MGANNTSNGQGAVAIGNSNTATGQGSMALGNASSASAAGGVALGDTAVANNTNDVALGSHSTTAAPHTGTTAQFGGTAAGVEAAASTNGVVSVGAAGTERQIQNVAAGVISATSTDAINGSQLNSVVTGVNNLGTTTAGTLGGGASYDPTTGNVTGFSQPINTVSNTGAVTGPTAQTTVAGALTALNTNIDNTANIAVKYDAAGGSKITLGATGGAGAGAPVTITNLAPAALNATSTDAVNGSQLFGTNQNVANITNGKAGPFVSDNSVTAVQPVSSGANASAGGFGATATGAASTVLGNQSTDNGNANATVLGQGASIAAGTAGSNVALGQGSTVAAAAVPTAGATIGGTAYTFAGGAPTGVVSVGSAGSARQVTNVAAGQLSGASTDAVNGSQLFATNQQVTSNTTAINNISNGGGIKYFHANSTLADSTATGTDSVAVGPAAVATGAGSFAAGNGATANNANDVALGAGSTTAVAVGTPSTVINGASFNFAGTAPTSTVSVGSFGNERTITNVAAGRLSGTSTDAVNGSQLFATNTAVTNLGTTVTNINNGGGIKYFHANSILADSQATGTDSVASGPLAVASGASASAYGNGASAAGVNSVAVGNQATASNIDATALGFNANASGRNSIALGSNAVAVGNVSTNGGPANGFATAIGQSASATGSSSTAIGGNSLSSGTKSLALGDTAASSATRSVAIGSNANATADFALAIGNLAKAINAGDVALGSGSATAAAVGTPSAMINGITYNFAGTTPVSTVSVGSAGNERTITNVAAGRLSITSTDAVNGSQLNATNTAVTAIGNTLNNISNGGGIKYFHTNSTLADSNAAGTDSIAVGPVANAYGNDSIAQGLNAVAGVNGTPATANDIALGNGAQATGGNSIAQGTGAIANSAGAIAIGQTATATGGKAVSIGAGNTASGDGAVAIGDPNNATGTGAVAMGANNTSNGQGTVALGNANTATGQGSVALGNSSQANNAGSIALGDAATVSAAATQGIAIGSGASSNNPGAVALGAGSTTAAAIATTGVTINGTAYNFAGTTPASTVSVGAFGAERTITNVAAGQISAISTDAINGSQLFATNTAIDTLGTTVTNITNGKAGPFVSDNSITAVQPVSSGANASAGGFGATATGAASTVLGNQATDNGNADATVLGQGASIAVGTSGSNVALGQGSTVTSAAIATTGATIGGTAYIFAGGAPIGVVSVGSVGGERQITNVAAGQLSASSTDAVNGSQLYATNQQVTVNTTNIAGNTAAISNITAGKAGPFVSDSSVTATQPVSSGANASAGGFGAVASATNSTALGNGAQATAANSTAIGQGATASTANSVALGNASTTGAAVATTGTTISGNSYNFAGAAPVGVVSVGSAGSERQVTNVAAGQLTASSTDAVNGSQLFATNTAINNLTSVVALGQTKYYSVNSTGGSNEHNEGATGQDAIASGKNAAATSMNAVAIGSGASATASGGVALGGGATADRAGMNGGKEQFSNTVVSSTQGAVSVGSVGNERQITNVAGGTQATDAVNVRQLQAVQSGGVRYDTNPDGSTNYSSVTMGNGSSAGPVTIHNVAAGTAPTDAVNVQQFNSGLGAAVQQANQYTDSRVQALQNSVDSNRHDADGGSAAAMAVGGLPQPSAPGKSMVAIAGSTFQGQTGLALGISTISENGRWVYKAAATSSSRGQTGGVVSAGFQW